MIVPFFIWLSIVSIAHLADHDSKADAAFQKDSADCGAGNDAACDRWIAEDQKRRDQNQDPNGKLVEEMKRLRVRS